jgi:hypothetical protein
MAKSKIGGKMPAALKVGKIGGKMPAALKVGKIGKGAPLGISGLNLSKGLPKVGAGTSDQPGAQRAKEVGRIPVKKTNTPPDFSAALERAAKVVNPD